MKYLILFATFLFLFRPVFPVLNYIMHYDYIKKELCENKDKPELHCNGKCHLKKELAKASNENPPASQDSNVKMSLELVFLESIPEFNFKTFLIEIPQVSDFYSRLYFRLHSTSIFHPPIA